MLDVARTPRATLTRAREIALRQGLRHVYTGNVRDAAGQSTYCHACGRTLIGRDGYEITASALRASRALRALRHAVPRRVRGPARPLGPAPHAGLAGRGTARRDPERWPR